MRSKYGKANWHTGQEILKNAAITGPFFKAPPNEKEEPSSEFSLKSGADVPTLNAVMVRPPKIFRSRISWPTVILIDSAELYRTNPLAFKIFLVNPVRGIRSSLDGAIHFAPAFCKPAPSRTLTV